MVFVGDDPYPRRILSLSNSFEITSGVAAYAFCEGRVCAAAEEAALGAGVGAASVACFAQAASESARARTASGAQRGEESSIRGKVSVEDRRCSVKCAVARIDCRPPARLAPARRGGSVRDLAQRRGHIVIPLSVLDLVPVSTAVGPTAAIHESVALARRVDELGFTRYWLAEHHSLPSIASSAPEVLIAHIAGETRRIRVGAGGMMLPNHAPLHLLEVFKTLEAPRGQTR